METKPDKKLGHWIFNKKSKVQCLMSNVFSLRAAGCGLPPSLRLPASLKLRWTRRRTCRSDSRGFSLLELMTVMLIMFIMMGIATTSFRGLVRGAGMRGAVTVVRSTLMQARQHAMMNGQRVAVLITQEADKEGTMLTLVSYGRIANAGGGIIYTESELPWSGEQLGGATIYNFAGDRGVLEDNKGSLDTAGITASQTAFMFKSGSFSAGDVAFAMGPARELPTGLQFDGLTNGDRQIIIFSADGSVEQAETFDLVERASGAGFTISIDSSTGKVELADL